MKTNLKIGVFDSGVGGMSIVNTIQREIPNIQINYQTDKDNIPYGDKTKKELLKLVIPKLQLLEAKNQDVIVMACNTVTTTIIKEIRAKIKTPIVAVEPMVKPACEQTITKKITICATPATLASPRYSELKELYANGVEVFEPDCSNWAYLIENNQQNQQNIEGALKESLDSGSDIIVLACTHYHWIEEEIKEIASKYNVKVLQPEQALVAQLKKVLTKPKEL